MSTPSTSLQATAPRPLPFAVAVAIAAAIAMLDQLIKYYVAVPLALESRYSLEILPILRFIWAENCGVALSLFAECSNEQRWLLIALTSAVTLAIAVWMYRSSTRGERLSLALIIGGALGNIIDRLVHGYVVDYIDLHFGDFRPFFIFNFADISISCGVVLLLWCEFRPRRPATDSPKDSPKDSPTDSPVDSSVQ